MGKSNADIRISYTERDEAVSALGVHLSTGRLELSEYEERCGQAAVAQTRGELEVLFTDLPAPHPDLSSATRPTTSLVQKTGQLVTMSKGSKKSAELTQTPASSAFEVIGGMMLIFGMPGALLLTIFLGMWWVFIPVTIVLVVAGALSDALKKPKPGS